MEIEEEKTLESKLNTSRSQWTDKIQTMSAKIEKIPDVQDLMSIIYSERQIAVEYYYTLLSLLSKQNKIYKAKYSELFLAFKKNEQIRYSDSQIQSLINGELSELYYNIDLLNTQQKFMSDSIKTIDGLIYGINNRLKLEEFIRGLK